ncbi:MAG: MucB/RseB C-terminal domain-containing protein [Rubrivivax sp.]
MQTFATPLRRMQALAFWAMLASATAALAGPADAASKPLPPSEARQWLVRIHAAAHERNYQGTLVFSADGALSSARVAHFCDGAQSYERIEVLDGRMQQTYRHNDRVYTLWPHSRVAVVEERDPRQASLRPVIEPRAQEQYDLHEQGTDHVAGREAQILLLSPRDENRFAQRLWIDSRSGLMLRADVLGPRQQVLESSAFSQVEIGIKAQPRSVLQPMKQLAGYRQVRPEQVATQFDSEGWTLRAIVPGFQLSSCTRRLLDPVDAGAAPSPVLQAVFSDGLTHVSMFVEAFDRQRHKQPLLTQMGATHTLMQPHGTDWWVTVMGDVPASTLKQFHQALERRR